MVASPKEWAALLGADRDSDERTMAARTRVMARVLGYLDEYFSDPDGERPPEAVVMEFAQFLVLAEAMEAKGKGAKFKELCDAIVHLHLNWDEVDRGEAFEAIANRREYIEHQLAAGSPIVALTFADGILLFTLSRERQKIFEIYDRIAMGGIGHTLPYLIRDFRTATTVAVVVVAAELGAISYIRHRYMDTPFLRAAFSVIVGGVLVLLTGILIGSS